MRTVTVTFGKIMLRLTPPGFERSLQKSPVRRMVAGGANVAVALAQFGLPSAYITVPSDRNPIAYAAIADLRPFGVDASKIVRGKRRMGTCYVDAGTD